MRVTLSVSFLWVGDGVQDCVRAGPGAVGWIAGLMWCCVIVIPWWHIAELSTAMKSAQEQVDVLRRCHLQRIVPHSNRGACYARAEFLHRSLRPHDHLCWDRFDERTFHQRAAIVASIQTDNIRPELIGSGRAQSMS